MTFSKDTARIYVACLASYNNGILHGAWLDLSDYDDEEELGKDIQEKVFATSSIPNAEEFAIDDMEDFSCERFESLKGIVGKYKTLAKFEEDYGQIGFSCFEENLEICDIESINSGDACLSFYEDAEDYVDQIGILQNMPEFIKRYFDVESFVQDTILLGDGGEFYHNNKVMLYTFS